MHEPMNGSRICGKMGEPASWPVFYLAYTAGFALLSIREPRTFFGAKPPPQSMTGELSRHTVPPDLLCFGPLC
jgi:hypothetical protein